MRFESTLSVIFLPSVLIAACGSEDAHDVAHEGEFDLSKYPSINAWMGRVAAQPNHVTISHKN